MSEKKSFYRDEKFFYFMKDNEAYYLPYGFSGKKYLIDLDDRPLVKKIKTMALILNFFFIYILITLVNVFHINLNFSSLSTLNKETIYTFIQNVFSVTGIGFILYYFTGLFRHLFMYMLFKKNKHI